MPRPCKFRDDAQRDEGRRVIADELVQLNLEDREREGKPFIHATLREDAVAEIKSFALQQNMTSLRNRVDELGVAEPVVQQQGDRRIVVQLPGVQDTARAKPDFVSPGHFRLLSHREHLKSRARRVAAHFESKKLHVTVRNRCVVRRAPVIH